MLRSRQLFAVLSVVALAACEERDDSTAPSTGNARVRVVHVSPTAPAITVTRGGGQVAASLAFGAVFPATGYATTPAGPGVLVVTAAAAGTTVYSAQAPLVRDSGATIVALGNVGAAFVAGSARSFQPIVLKDTAAAAPATAALLRIVHAADSVSATVAGVAASGVDIYIYPQGTPRPTAAPAAGTAIRLINATFRAVTAYQSLTTAGTYTVEVFVTGAAPATATPLVATTLPVALATKTTIVARGAQVGATAAPLNAFGLILLPEA